MALPDIQEIQTQVLDLWFSNLVDSINFNISQIEVAVPALANVLTTIDVAPIEYLKDSLKELVDNINSANKEIEARIEMLESKVSQGGRNGVV